MMKMEKITLKKLVGTTETELGTQYLISIEENTNLKVELKALESTKYVQKKLKYRKKCLCNTFR